MDIATGSHHTCVVFSSGTIRCWGNNPGYQLGYGNTLNVGGTSYPNFPHEAGDIVFEDAGSPLDAELVAAGLSHTCAVLSDGNIRCWGYDGLTGGILGYGDSPPPDGELPRDRPSIVIGTGAVTDIDAGLGHTCAIADDDAYCWGSGNEGQIGNGSYTSQNTPTMVIGLPSGEVGQVAAGQRHSCARTIGGSIYCWGHNDYGQLGYSGASTNTALEVDSFGFVTDIAVGYDATCAVVDDRDLYCWGDDADGALGINCSGSEPTPTLVNIGVSEIVDVTMYANHTCARLSTGAIACWGDAWAGQIGYETDIDVCPPALDGGDELEIVQLDAPYEITQIATGRYHTCVALTSDAVRCWGRGEFGQLGYGHTDNISDGASGWTIFDLEDVPLLDI